MTVPGVLLFPGAGSDRSHPSLVAIESALGRVACVRADFPYRKAGRKAPDRAPVLLQAVRDEVAALGDRGAWVLGGRSMGGRIASMAVADANIAVGPEKPVYLRDVRSAVRTRATPVDAQAPAVVSTVPAHQVN